MHPDGMYKLIAAVINLAKRDYYRAMKHGSPSSGYCTTAAIENFFYGDWIQMLTLGQADPEMLIEQAKVGDYYNHG